MSTILAAVGGGATLALAIALVVYAVKLGNARVLSTQRLARIDELVRDKREIEERLSASESIRHESLAAAAKIADDLRSDNERLRKERERYAATDPAVAGELLAERLSNVPGAEAAPAARPATVPASPGARRGPSPARKGRK